MVTPTNKMASFVSANDLTKEREKRKEERRNARKAILEDAKESFLKEKKRRELKEERGDDKWVAPGIEKRLEYSYEKGKKLKKHKKEKKKKHKKDSNSDSEQDMWVEKNNGNEGVEPIKETTPTTSSEPAERQEWMLLPLGPMKSRLMVDDEEEKRERNLINKPGQHPLELNPYWKDGGRGIPEEEDQSKSSIAPVGDGGRSWLLRSYKRALEQSQEVGGASLEEIAHIRWGSLGNLYSLLKEAGIDPSYPDAEPRPPQDKRRPLYAGYDKGAGPERGRHRPIERPSYERFNPSRGFVRPGEGKGSGTSSSSSWMKDKPRPSPPPRPSYPETTPTRETTPPQSPPTPLVTDAQLNSIGAKLMKAEMLGDTDKVNKLKLTLEEMRQLKESQKGRGKPVAVETSERREEELLLTTSDRYGNVRPMKQQYPDKKHGYKPNSAHKHTHTGKGKRTKYFADDDAHSLKSLMEQERSMTAEDTHMAIARMAGNFVPSTNLDETVDDVLDSKRVTMDNRHKEDKRAQLRAMANTRANNEALTNCKLCVGNECFDKHLMVAMGMEVYLAVPAHQPLTEGHCLLIPRDHTPCGLQMDENVWEEVGIFRKGLTRMFSDRGLDVIFMETYTSVANRRHMTIECVPLPRETGELAPMYFKKAISEADAEWSDNKKLVDTSKKGVRGSLPKGLPYFFVEFGTDGGYGHVIEDQSRFPWYFGNEVCGGMLDCEPRLWLKQQRDSFERQKLRVLQLSEWWEGYDWTQKLNECN